MRKCPSTSNRNPITLFFSCDKLETSTATRLHADLTGGVVVEQVYDRQHCYLVAALCAVLVLEEGGCHACCEGIAAACRHLQNHHAFIHLFKTLGNTCFYMCSPGSGMYCNCPALMKSCFGSLQTPAGQQHQYKQYRPVARCAAVPEGCFGPAQRYAIIHYMQKRISGTQRMHLQVGITTRQDQLCCQATDNMT